MTSRYLSFCSISELHDNNVLTTSPIGELSNRTRTYAKDPGNYSNTGSPCVLYTFHSTTNEVPAAIPKEIANRQIEFCDWLFQQSKDKKLTNSSANCMQQLKATFSNNVEWTDIGVMVTNMSMWLPSHIHGFIIAGTERYEFKIWFANEYFETGFPYYEILVIHPIPIAGIDYLADKNYQQVAAKLAEQTTASIEARVLKLTNNSKYPYTDRYVLAFDIYDRFNKPQKNVGYWTIIIYGNGTDAEDQVYEAIKKCILDNSKYPESEWEEVIPDLFNPLEFNCVPYWDDIGLVNRITQSSTYSPIANYETALVNPKKYNSFYTQAHIIKSLQIMPVLYKSAKVAFVAKPTNFNNLIKIKDVYPDYQLIPSTDSQFGMMSKETTDFIKSFEELIAGAEILTPNSIPPAGIKRVEKNGYLYAVRKIGKVRYQMITYYQFQKDGLVPNE